MEQIVVTLFPVVCVWLAYTIVLIWWLRSDIRIVKEELERFKKTYWEDSMKGKK